MRDQLKADLLRERRLEPADVWAIAESRLSQHPMRGLNTAKEVCDRWASRPDRLAIVVRHSPDTVAERWTFSDLAVTSSRLATGLRERAGVKPGDRVAGYLSQGIEAHILALAVWRLGAVFVPLYPGFGVEGLTERLRSSEPAVVVAESVSLATLHEALTAVDSRAHVVVVDPPEQTSAVAFWPLIETHTADAPVLETSASDTATLIYTSGTTGTPKGCLLPHSYILTMQPFVRHAFALHSTDLFASTSSPGWVNGLYSAGCCVNAVGRARLIYTGRFDASAWLRVMTEENVTYLSSAPTAVRELLPAIDHMGLPPGLRGAACAGERQSPEITTGWAKFRAEPLQETYGTTEIGLVMATPAFADELTDPGPLPPVVPGFEVTLMHANGDPAAEAGIIAVRNQGYVGCTGYLNADREWANRWRGDWYLTGDLGKRDDAGRIWFQGRDDDLIVTAGYNVSPAEVEAVVLLHPRVRDVAVVGAPDERRGSVVRAVVVPKAGSEPVDQAALSSELKALVKERLGRHVYPRIIDFADELPRNPAGKVLRNVLRDQPLNNVGTDPTAAATTG